jgi:hypothetical protein
MPTGASFSAPVRTGIRAHPASCTLGTKSLFRGWSELDLALTPPPTIWRRGSRKSRAIPLPPPSGLSRPVLRWTVPFFRRFRIIAKSDYYLRQVLSVRLSVRTEQLGSHWTDFHEIWYLWIFRKTAKRIQVSLKSDKINGTLLQAQYTFLTTSRSVLLRMINVSDKSFRENQNTYFVFSNFFFFRKSCRLWDNVKKYFRAEQDTHSEYVTLIAFPLHSNNGCKNAHHC